VRPAEERRPADSAGLAPVLMEMAADIALLVRLKAAVADIAHLDLLKAAVDFAVHLEAVAEVADVRAAEAEAIPAAAAGNEFDNEFLISSLKAWWDESPPGPLFWNSQEPFLRVKVFSWGKRRLAAAFRPPA
jgi:hypothetical protein